jgi:hypothetical protein
MKIKIIENFLKKNDFKKLSSLRLKKISSNEIKVYHNNITQNNVVKATCLNKDFVKKMHKKYHSLALNILKELNPNKINLYEHSEFHIIETGSKYSFPIHDDTPNKLLSGVIYLTPKSNCGTFFYKNKNGDQKKEIKWKQNRAVFFSRLERQSWHSFKGDNSSNRLALVYNLMTTKIKKVAEIEKKNYWIMQLRFLLNPHLYRFFKFTI